MNKITIKELCPNMHSGGTPSTKIDEYWNGDIPWLSSSESNNEYINEAKQFITQKGVENSATKLAKKDSVIIATAGEGKTRGQVSYLNIDAYINQSLITMNPNEKIVLSKFLYFYLKNNYSRIRALSDITGVRGSLSGDLLGSFTIQYPNIFTQNKIVKLLSSIDDKIQNNNKINDELESMAKTLYDYWFLQFEFPNEEGKPYKSSGGKMVWNDELKREIPVGWEVEELKNIFTFIKGKIPEKLYDEKGENLYPYVTIEMASNGTCQYCEKENMQLCNGEVLMVMDGAASGNIFLGSKGVLGSTLAMLGRRRVDFSNSMIYCILDSNKEIYKKANTGSTVPHANRKFIEGMKIATPKNMSDFSSKFDSIFNIIITNKEQNKELQELRDFLLPMLMNGQIGFKEDKELAEANA